MHRTRIAKIMLRYILLHRYTRRKGPITIVIFEDPTVAVTFHVLLGSTADGQGPLVGINGAKLATTKGSLNRAFM